VIVTVRFAVMGPVRLAVASTALGTPSVHAVHVSQLPSASLAHAVSPLLAVNVSKLRVAGICPSGPPNAHTPTFHAPSMLGPPPKPCPGPVTTWSNVNPAPPTRSNVAPLSRL
jgi:hypothetical protein